MKKHQIINLLVDYYHHHIKPTPISISNNWSPNPVKQGMAEMFTIESLVRILRKEIGDKRIQAIKNCKDMIKAGQEWEFRIGKRMSNVEILKMATIEIDKILKPKSQYDYDGDCNYCDDNNCSNGECREVT